MYLSINLYMFHILFSTHILHAPHLRSHPVKPSYRFVFNLVFLLSFDISPLVVGWVFDVDVWRALSVWAGLLVLVCGAISVVWFSTGFCTACDKCGPRGQS